ncbi:MAG TPA: MotA/TolQ/ExbB proton channel family protein [Parachlamydiaceae bacterium]|nr:MotA/TolQ/ExbB proton channel family protein [Parachlamydiaceae bacterium]
MFVNDFFILASNPFFGAYRDSDFLGKLIFIGLIALSIISWILIIHKFLVLKSVKKNALKFYNQVQSQKNQLLNFDYPISIEEKKSNPFFYLFQIFKKQTMDLLNKNRSFHSEKEKVFLSPADISFIDAQLKGAIAIKLNDLERNLFILSTITSLAPFLGLLGTVWGILTTFSELQSMNSSAMLGGLSLALATTVIGLIDAIPALIGYNYFKNAIRDFEVEMEGFSREILSSVEMNYRQVDIAYG